MSIQSEITRLETAKSAIAAAIAGKGVTVPDGTLLDGMASLIGEIQAGGGGGTSTPTMKDVNFYDYDGTLVASYTLDDVQALTALPDGPTHDGLTFQGWNWTLEKVKALTRPMNVGAMYITDDGKTRLNIRIADKARSTVPLYFSQTVANGVNIDWGDGSASETLAGTGKVNTTHTYAAMGDFTIVLTVADGCELGLGHNSSSYCVMGSTENNGKVYSNILQYVHIGWNVTSIGDYAFSGCYSLASVTIPDSVTNIGEGVFSDCYSLASVTIPDSVTNIGEGVFSDCYSLASITIPNSVTSIVGYAFSYCYSLASVTIPDSVTNIGEGVFSDCHSLASITIPNSVTSIVGYAFSYCYSLASVTIPDSVTNIVEGAFSGCHSLASITIPNSVTSIGGYAFDNCYSLASVTIPDSVTNIGDYAFSRCYSLASVTIPNSVTSIGDGAFRYCYGMGEYHMKPTTPPKLLGTSAFNYIPSDCIIYVPSGCLEAYQSATNWSAYASYMQEEPV